MFLFWKETNIVQAYRLICKLNLHEYFFPIILKSFNGHVICQSVPKPTYNFFQKDKAHPSHLPYSVSQQQLSSSIKIDYQSKTIAHNTRFWWVKLADPARDGVKFSGVCANILVLKEQQRQETQPKMCRQSREVFLFQTWFKG